MCPPNSRRRPVYRTNTHLAHDTPTLPQRLPARVERSARLSGNQVRRLHRPIVALRRSNAELGNESSAMSDAERSASALQPLPSNRQALAVDRDQCMCRVSWVTTTQHWLCTSNRAGLRGSQLLRLLWVVSSWCGEPAHCAGPLLRRRDGCLRIAFSVR